jgi:hypothetical protein
MEIVPIIASGQKDFNLSNIYKLIKNGTADTVAGNFKVTAKQTVDFLFSDPIYTVILIIFKL